MLGSLKDRFQLKFKNREFAAKILAGALEDSLKKIKVDKKSDNLLVLGIPRGGVIVADFVAQKLISSHYKCNFDIVIPRKLTAPGNQEIAIGAIFEDGTLYLNEDLIRDLGISSDYLEAEKSRQLEEIKRRKSIYLSKEIELDLKDQTVILVDDGAASGATIIVDSRWIKKQKPSKIVIEIPVTSKNILEILKRESDLVVTGTTPSATNFKTVGQYYQEFKPVEDEDIINVIKKHTRT
ncbi:MAG TPA: phosphoribosyltransferase family protein [Candidatus Nitrosocosmicus sp.]|nr:phosphoribosyltransferase family protein [Candidatus Nitrosocosmicus sp.]